MVVTRRERVRAATVQEIKDVARQQLVALGPGSVSLRAIAREMGMTAPALYRYFPSFDHLVRTLVADMHREVCNVMAAAKDIAAASEAAPPERLIAAAQAFRGWAVEHRAEFGLLFGSPLPTTPSIPAQVQAGVIVQTRTTTPFTAAGGTGIIVGLFEQMWQQHPYLTPAPDDIYPALLQQLVYYRETTHTGLPTAALYVAVSAWLRILGAVSLEVFGHMPLVPRDGAAFFSQQLREILAALGVAEKLSLLNN